LSVRGGEFDHGDGPGAPGTGGWDSSDALLVLGLHALLLVLFCAAGSTVGWWLGLPLSGAIPLASAIATGITLILVTRRLCPDRWPATAARLAAILIGIVAASTLAAGRFLDLSWDGQGYHQRAIIALAEGWNPVWDGDPPGARSTVPLRHYPKLVETTAAEIYRLSGSIELGKSINWLVLAASFLFCAALLFRVPGVGKRTAVGLATLAALNPVALCQLSTFYVDGVVASLATAAIACGLLYLIEPRTLALAAFAVSISLLAAVKTSGLVYGAVIALGLILGAVVWRRVLVFRLASAALGAFLAATLVLAFHPYVTNTVRYESSLYPFIGAGDRGAEWIIGAQRPHGFGELGRGARLAESLASRSQNAIKPHPATLKLPFSSRKSEWTVFSIPDVRVGGFGPLFSAALFFAAITFAASWARSPNKWRRTGHRAAGLAAAVIVASVLVTPEGWWARLAPQMWLLPLVLVVPSLAKDGDRRLPRFAAVATLGLMAVNTLGVGAVNFSHNLRLTRSVSRQLDELAHSGREVAVDFGWAESNRVRFERRRIDYHEVEASRMASRPTGTLAPFQAVKYWVESGEPPPEDR